MSETMYAKQMPVLALRGLAIFPEQTVHFDIGRNKSIQALEAAMKQDQTLFLVPQKDLLVDDPKLGDLCAVGTVAKIKQILRAQGESYQVLVKGICRGKIAEMTQSEPFLSGIVEAVPVQQVQDSPRLRALRREINSLYALYLQMSEHPAQAIQLRMMASDDSGFLADSVAQNSGMDIQDKIKLLCQLNPALRLENTVKLLRQEVEILRLEAGIQEKTKAALDQNQRDYYLREQMKVIREELGEEEDENETEDYAARIRSFTFSRPK